MRRRLSCRAYSFRVKLFSPRTGGRGRKTYLLHIYYIGAIDLMDGNTKRTCPCAPDGTQGRVKRNTDNTEAHGYVFYLSASRR